jgi:hypothetical protein
VLPDHPSSLRTKILSYFNAASRHKLLQLSCFWHPARKTIHGHDRPTIQDRKHDILRFSTRTTPSSVCRTVDFDKIQNYHMNVAYHRLFLALAMWRTKIRQTRHKIGS